MRRLIIALCLVAGVAVAEPDVYDAGGFRYFVWTNTVSTNWTPPFDAEAEVLVVGGGGSGGSGRGSGGGGAGGLVLTNITLSADETNTIVVGAGAVAPTGTSGSNEQGNNGDNSSAFGLVALGGGGGGPLNAPNDGADGGSGGGGLGGSDSAFGGAGLQPSSISGGFGNKGGDSTGDANSVPLHAGGGGGAGAAGQDAQGTTKSGDGGAGMDLSTWLSGLDLGDDGWFAGGGGGAPRDNGTAGSGGKGGGADGITGANGLHGQPNTGGGGGGAGGANTVRDGGSGGSGIVIVRVRIPDQALLNYFAETRQAFTTFSWLPPLEGDPTNYVIRIGTESTNLPVVAETSDTSVLVDLRNHLPDSSPESFWRVDTQTESGVIEGTATQFRYILSAIGDPSAEPVTARADPRLWAAFLRTFEQHGILTPIATQASSSAAARDPEKTLVDDGLSFSFDGFAQVPSPRPTHSTSSGYFWLSDDTATSNQWIMYDLGDQYEVSGLIIYNYNSGASRAIKDATIYVSNAEGFLSRDSELWGEAWSGEFPQASQNQSYEGFILLFDSTRTFRSLKIDNMTRHDANQNDHLGLGKLRVIPLGAI